MIVDEAHSSQSGEAAADLKGVLAGKAIKEEAKQKAEAEGLTDYEEEILEDDGEARAAAEPELLRLHRHARNTRRWRSSGARTPTASRSRSTSTPCARPSRRSFILDVLKNYTTYKTYFKLIKSDRGRPEARQEARRRGRWPASSACTPTTSRRRPKS